jgi:hypothetical protein
MTASTTLMRWPGAALLLTNGTCAVLDLIVAGELESVSSVAGLVERGQARHGVRMVRRGVLCQLVTMMQP